MMHERWLLQPALDCLNAGKHIFIEKAAGRQQPRKTQMLLDAAIANNVYAMWATSGGTRPSREAMRRAHAKGPVSTVVGTLTSSFWATPPRFFQHAVGR
ncbi:MAG: hypothetical protein R2911_40130 [Caldilineaceae bacterium]